MAYGYEPKAKNDHMVRIMEQYLKAEVSSVTPGGTVIMETFPFRMFADTMTACSFTSTTILVLRLPSWFPGATFKRASVECLKAGHDVREIPFQDVKDRMVNHLSRSLSNHLTNRKQSNGQVPPCLVADTMNRMNGFENEVIETAIKEAAALTFAGTQAE